VVCRRAVFFFRDFSFAEPAGILVENGVASWVSAAWCSLRIESLLACGAFCDFVLRPADAFLLGVFRFSPHLRDWFFAFWAFLVQQVVLFAALYSAPGVSVHLFGVASSAGGEGGGQACAAVDRISTFFAIGSASFLLGAARGVDGSGLAARRTVDFGVGVALAFLRCFLLGNPPALPAAYFGGLVACSAFVPGEPFGVASNASLQWSLVAAACLVFFIGCGFVEKPLVEMARVRSLVSALAVGAGFHFLSAAAGGEVACTCAFLAFVGPIWFFASAAESSSFRLAVLAVGLVLFENPAFAGVEDRFLALALFVGHPSVSRGFPSFFLFLVVVVSFFSFSALGFLLFGHGFFFSSLPCSCGSAEVGF
jgi:hypothetical protein